MTNLTSLGLDSRRIEAWTGIAGWACRTWGTWRTVRAVTPTAEHHDCDNQHERDQK